MELLSVGVQGFSRAALACALALTAIPLTTEWARRVGLVDQPRGRRQHRHAVPLTGGLAIFFGFAASGLTLDIEPHLLYGLFLPAGILLIAGVLDDLFELRPIAKFALQFVAILSAVLLGGLRIESLGNLLGTGPVLLGEWSIPFTIFAVVGVINAINMIDGMDGLAAMIVVAALAWFGVSAYSVGATLEVALIVVLVGAVAGFLAFNFRIPWGREALVFMGDSGSAVLGFLVAWFAIELSQGPHRALYPISAVWILAVPILDTLSVMLRRVARRRSPFQGDRDHVHHLLVGRGVCYGSTVSSLCLTSAMLGAVGVYGVLFGVPESWLFWTLLVLFVGHVVVCEVSVHNPKLRRRLRALIRMEGW